MCMRSRHARFDRSRQACAETVGMELEANHQREAAVGQVRVVQLRHDEAAGRRGDGALLAKTASELLSKAFGALRKSVFGSTSVTFHAKKAVYETLILSIIMLFGSESWCLPERNFAVVFVHRYCPFCA